MAGDTPYVRPCPRCEYVPCKCDDGIEVTPVVSQLEGERICFREWSVGEDLGLYSTGVGERWEREMVADSSRCGTPFPESPAHERSPDSDCLGCGLHAFYEVHEGLDYAADTTGLLGAVVVSGRTMLGPTGVRAEKARVVLLAYANDRQKALADAASRKLGVGCCALADLERLALEYGQPVPDDEKPEREEGHASGWLSAGALSLAQSASIHGNTLGPPSGSGISFGTPSAWPHRALKAVKDALYEGFTTTHHLYFEDCERVVVQNSNFRQAKGWPSRFAIDAKRSKDCIIQSCMFDGGGSKFPPARVLRMFAAAVAIGVSIGVGSTVIL